jgi:hypothetical protein
MFSGGNFLATFEEDQMRLTGVGYIVYQDIQMVHQ